MPVQRKLVENKLTQQGLEQFLMTAADILRGTIRPEKYADYMLPLFFFKRLSDVWTEEHEQALQRYKSEEMVKQKFVPRFIIPEGCLWEDVSREREHVREKLDATLERIAKANPGLDGVINRTNFNKQEDIPQDRLIELVEHFSQYRLGSKSVPVDVVGYGYESLLKQFSTLAPQRAGEFYTPREVVRVMVQILNPTEGDEVYDPCCRSGGMLIACYQHLASQVKDPKKLSLYGMEINSNVWTIAKINMALHDLEAEIKQGDALADPKFLEGAGLKKFDIAITNPMWNQDGYKEVVQHDRFERFSYGIPPDHTADWAWIQHMLASLKPNGRMGIVLDRGALFRGGAEGQIRKKILEEDLIECVVALPEKLFYNTAAPGCLIFLNKNKPKHKKDRVLFIHAGRDFEKLRYVNRLRDQDGKKIIRTGKNYEDVAEYARIVALDRIGENDHNLSVTRYLDVFDEERIQSMAVKLGYPSIPLNDVCLATNLTRSGKSFEDRPNAVYLPIIGRSEAVASLSELQLKPHNYVQIVTKPELADARYVAGFFNTPLGLVIREGLSTGGVIPKISKSSLSRAMIFLPDQTTQLKIIEGNTKITDLSSEIQELQQRLWSQPREIEKHLEDLRRVNREERFSEWLDTLPFPLASILWTYHASGDNYKDRYEHLLHFFEALAEFTAIVLLSGFASNKTIFQAERQRLHGILSKSQLSMERSSFGTWNSIVGYLAKRGRDLLDGSEDEQRLCRNLFKTSSYDVLKMLFDSGIVAMLQETNSLRNQWLGHGGIVSDRLAHERHVTLQTYLSRVRQRLATTWENYELIQPRSLQFVGGVYDCSAGRLMGNRTPFEEAVYKTSEPLESRKLYLLTPTDTIALEILPLLKVMPSPKTEHNACYFYNRRQDNRIRFVSYHFDQEAEVVDQFPDTARIIDLITSEKG